MKKKLFNDHPSHNKKQGFTLVEMAVVVVIIGLVVGITVKLLSGYQQRTDVNRAENIEQANNIEQAINGFVYANKRLPCPDEVIAGTRDGKEDCTATAGGKLAVGFLPYKTLQLYQQPGRAWADEVAYAAYRLDTADLSVLAQQTNRISSAHIPSCSGDENSSTIVDGCSVNDKAGFVDTSSVVLNGTSSALNMLDFCESLRLATIATPATSLLHIKTPTTTNVAYAFALPSSARLLVDGSGYLESRQGLAVPTEFNTSLANGANLDDFTRLQSFNKLYQSYDCPNRMTAVESVYLRDLSLITNEYTQRIRLANADIMYALADGDIGSAERDVIFAAINIATSAASLALSIAELSTINLVAIAGIVVATLGVADAIANLVLANAALADANDWKAQVVIHRRLFRKNLVISGSQLNKYRSISHAAELRGSL